MAHDFERVRQRNVGTSATAILSVNSDDAIISIRCANTTTSTIRYAKWAINNKKDFLKKNLLLFMININIK